MTQSRTRAGSTFGHYEIRRLLGRGGMGEVYEARDTAKDRVVALKILSDEHSRDATFRERFRRESHATARLQEPHVIPIHDWGEVDGSLYIDMRLVKGVDLRTLLQNGPLRPQRAVGIISQVAAALDAAHAAGLVHRDVKPENIIVTPDDFAYLVDFGIAQSDADTRLTTVGAAIGSFAYMSPERFGAENITPAADIYSLACVLYESLTGVAPFATRSLPQVIVAHASAPPPRPSTTNPAVPVSFDGVIARAMAKDPASRYGTTSAFARAAQWGLHAAHARPDSNDTLPARLISVPAPQAAHRSTRVLVMPSLLAALTLLIAIGSLAQPRSERLGDFLILEGLVVFVAGLIGLARGRIKWARIETRKMAGLVAGAGFAVLAVGGALSPSPTAPKSGVRVPAPLMPHRPASSAPVAPPPIPAPVPASPPAPPQISEPASTPSSGSNSAGGVAPALPPLGATAQCRDGTYSFSRHHSGACSDHEGVAKWLP